MKRRLLYGSALVLLMISVTLVIWEGSFDFGGYGPSTPEQTFIFWAVSTLIFLLMVTLGFMLVRLAIKLYIERRSHREGSRIKTKLVIGALALSFMPVFFMVLFSIHVMNRNLDKWFSRPVEAERIDLNQIAAALQRELRGKAETQAALLASRPETRLLLTSGVRTPGFLNRFCASQNLVFAAIRATEGGAPLDRCGSPETGEDAVTVAEPVQANAESIGSVTLQPRISLDIRQQRAAIQKYNNAYARLAGMRRNVRQSSLLILALITLFVLFVATWIALFLSRQISVPIAALLKAAGEVRGGNLHYRVETPAIDELAALVRGFNEMTRELEANSRELEARRRFTEAILESIPTGVISISADGAIQKTNRALRQILAEDAVSRAARLEDLFSREDTAELRYLMKRARRTGAVSRQLDIASGPRTLHLAVTVSALEDRSRGGFVIVLEDTSELLRAQKSAAWNEVARRVAHEIKNPLTPIAISAERVRRLLDRAGAGEPPAESTIRECVETIIQEVESVKNLVNEFSQFSRFPAAQPAPSDLNEVVEGALAVFAGRLDGIELRAQLAPGLPPVNIDREQFKRVVVNLVDNAAEAMQDALVRQILIATQPGAGDSVELIVADTGHGVSSEDREKLFLPYFSTRGRGTGLGLAIVSNILSDHGAHVRVEDNYPSGTRFTIDIPAIMEAPEEARTAPADAVTA